MFLYIDKMHKNSLNLLAATSLGQKFGTFYPLIVWNILA